MIEQWFAGQGWTAVGVALLMFALSCGILLWLRGPGTRPHDPPVNREAVRWAAVSFALMGAGWLVDAVAGVGGVAAVGAIVVAVAIGASVRARSRS
jgi:peptidoglycan/LPS O-acetylase OafA/YrhL